MASSYKLRSLYSNKRAQREQPKSKAFYQQVQVSSVLNTKDSESTVLSPKEMGFNIKQHSNAIAEGRLPRFNF